MPLNHCGTQIIESERLVLRQYTKSDAQSVFDNWACDPKVTKHLTWKPHANVAVTSGIIKAWIDNYKKSDYYDWAITLKDTGVAIGSINIHNCEDRERRGEIGYCLSREYWNRGIMTEALQAVIGFGFKTVGFERIQATHHTDNPASGRVMQKAGMTHEGTLRKYNVRNDGSLTDSEMYAIIKEDLK